MSNRNEAETRAELIDPALKQAGWGEVDGSRVRREVIAPGRIQSGGKRSSTDIADYVLVFKGHKLAVIEAKEESAEVTEGLGQAKRQAPRGPDEPTARSGARSASPTNGGAGLSWITGRVSDPGPGKATLRPSGEGRRGAVDPTARSAS